MANCAEPTKPRPMTLRGLVLLVVSLALSMLATRNGMRYLPDDLGLADINLLVGAYTIPSLVFVHGFVVLLFGRRPIAGGHRLADPNTVFGLALLMATAWSLAKVTASGDLEDLGELLETMDSLCFIFWQQDMWCFVSLMFFSTYLANPAMTVRALKGKYSLVEFWMFMGLYCVWFLSIMADAILVGWPEYAG